MLHWNTSVREKEISAEIRPLLNAVKNAEPHMLNPHEQEEQGINTEAVHGHFHQLSIISHKDTD